jgi:group I intron endonuclease
MGRRVYVHVRSLINDRHENKHLQAAWNKYGQEAFQYEILESCTVDNVKAREQAWLDSIKESGVPVFNKHFSASGIEKGFRHSAENRAKMRERLSHFHPWTGRKHSEESRAKISVSAKVSPAAIAARVRTAEIKKGSHHSKETRAKISAAGKGRVFSTVSRAKLSQSLRTSERFRMAHLAALNARKGKPLSAGLRAKLSLAGKLRKHSIETKAKISNSLLTFNMAKNGLVPRGVEIYGGAIASATTFTLAVKE